MLELLKQGVEELLLVLVLLFAPVQLLKQSLVVTVLDVRRLNPLLQFEDVDAVGLSRDSCVKG